MYVKEKQCTQRKSIRIGKRVGKNLEEGAKKKGIFLPKGWENGRSCIFPTPIRIGKMQDLAFFVALFYHYLTICAAHKLLQTEQKKKKKK